MGNHDSYSDRSQIEQMVLGRLYCHVLASVCKCWQSLERSAPSLFVRDTSKNRGLRKRLAVRAAAWEDARRARHLHHLERREGAPPQVHGEDAVVNYRTTPDWDVAVRELTSGRGVDEVIDIGGGTLEKPIKSVAWEGEVEYVGRLDGKNSMLDPNLLYRSISKLRVVAAGNKVQFLALNRVISVAGLKPVIDRVFSFDEVPAAFRYYESTQPLGKVVISHK